MHAAGSGTLERFAGAANVGLVGPGQGAHRAALDGVGDRPHGLDDIRHEVLAPIVAHLAKRDLRSRDDHRFAEAGEHEGEGGGRVRHRVGAVQHDEAVVAAIVLGDIARDLHPLARRHVRGVEQGRVLVDRERRDGRIPEFRHRRHLLLKVTRFGTIACASALHPDGAAGVGDVDPLSQTNGLYRKSGRCEVRGSRFELRGKRTVLSYLRPRTSNLEPRFAGPPLLL